MLAWSRNLPPAAASSGPLQKHGAAPVQASKNNAADDA